MKGLLALVTLFSTALSLAGKAVNPKELSKGCVFLAGKNSVMCVKRTGFPPATPNDNERDSSLG